MKTPIGILGTLIVIVLALIVFSVLSVFGVSEKDDPNNEGYP